MASLPRLGPLPHYPRSPSPPPSGAVLINSFRTCFQPGSRFHFRTCLEIKQASTARAWLAGVGRDGLGISPWREWGWCVVVGLPPGTCLWKNPVDPSCTWSLFRLTQTPAGRWRLEREVKCRGAERTPRGGHGEDRKVRQQGPGGRDEVWMMLCKLGAKHYAKQQLWCVEGEEVLGDTLHGGLQDSVRGAQWDPPLSPPTSGPAEHESLVPGG